MSETKTITGNRDDVVVDVSRCLRMRFCESSCRHCADICPHGAVMVDGSLAIDPELCRGCLLCTTVCPSGALEQNADFYACLAKLSKVPEAVLGCIRAKESSNATVACLGALSEEHLLTLYHTMAGRLTLNLTLCSDCPNSPVMAKLRERCDNLSDAQLSCGSCCIDIVESVQNLHYRDESLDRRSFFKSFRNALFTTADIIISNSNGEAEIHAEYAAKRLPARRKMLNSVRATLSRELESRLRIHFDPIVTIDDNCSACQGCVAICPTGALKAGESDTKPVIDHPLCTGCGLCREFCLDGALRILNESPRRKQRGV